MMSISMAQQLGLKTMHELRKILAYSAMKDPIFYYGYAETKWKMDNMFYDAYFAVTDDGLFDYAILGVRLCKCITL